MKTIQLVTAVSAGTNQNSPYFVLDDLLNYSVAVDFSGSDLAGTLKLQCSNDASDWVDVANSSQSVTAAASHIWNVFDAAYRYVRAVWTYSSGTGTWTVKVVIKEPVRAV